MGYSLARCGISLPEGNPIWAIVVNSGSAASVAAQFAVLREEQIAKRRRGLLDGADFGHELRRLEHFLRLQRVVVILVTDDLANVVDRVFLVLRGREIKLGGGALVVV